MMWEVGEVLEEEEVFRRREAPTRKREYGPDYAYINIHAFFFFCRNDRM
jgi:hypothetical protein